MLAVQADGHDILTVEGIAPSADELHPLQQAFCSRLSMSIMAFSAASARRGF